MAKAKKKAPAKKAAKAVAKKPVKKAASAAKAAKKAAPAKIVAKKTVAASMNLSNFMSPLDDRLVVQPLKRAEKTAGGLYIPDAVEQSAQTEGLVLAVGPGHRNKKGRVRPMDVNVGDKVIYPQFAGSSLNIMGNDVQILRESEILALLLDSKR